MTKEITSDPLHVVMVMPTYLPETYGGAEQQGRKFSKELIRRGHKVTILAPRLYKSTLLKEDMDGVRIIRFSLGALPNLGGPYFLSFLKWCFHIISWLWSNRKDYHVIHVFHGRLHAVPAVMSSKLVRKPVLIKIGRGGDHFDLNLLEAKTLYGPLFAKIVKSWSTGYIANSSEIVEDLRAKHIPEDRIHAIANGVELPNLEEEEGQDLNQEQSRQLLRYVYLGRLDTEKNVHILIEAFAKVDRKHKIHLDIVGDGPLLPDLQKIADECNAADRITFCGRTNDVASYLRAADYFVSASASEGMSNALLEAMSYGVVPIVTNVSGVENLVRDGIQGLVFDTKPIERFVAVIEKSASLSADDHRCLSTAARDRIEQNFSLAKIAEDHIKLYYSVLTNAPS